MINEEKAKELRRVAVNIEFNNEGIKKISYDLAQHTGDVTSKVKLKIKNKTLTVTISKSPIMNHASFISNGECLTCQITEVKKWIIKNLESL